MKNHEKLKKLTHSLLEEIGEDPGSCLLYTSRAHET